MRASGARPGTAAKSLVPGFWSAPRARGSSETASLPVRFAVVADCRQLDCLASRVELVSGGRLAGERQRPGVASSGGLGLDPGADAGREPAVAVVAGEHRDRGDDAGVPVSDEFPRPRDFDDQQCDQQVANEPVASGLCGSG